MCRSTYLLSYLQHTVIITVDKQIKSIYSEFMSTFSLHMALRFNIVLYSLMINIPGEVQTPSPFLFLIIPFNLGHTAFNKFPNLS